MSSPEKSHPSSRSQEKSQEENRDAFRLLVDSIYDYGIIMLDPSGGILSWNAGAENLHGYSPDEAIGENFSMFYLPDEKTAGRPAKALQDAALHGKYEGEGWRVRKDGSHFWASIVITRINGEEGRLIGFSQVNRDLTEKRQADQAIRESEERFRLLVESTKDYGIFMLDPKGYVVSWNAGAQRINGWSAEEIVGRHFSTFYPPEDVKAGKTEMELDVAAKVGRFEDHGWRVRKDGSRFWANVVITALHDDQGRLRGFGKVTRDITEQKIAQDRLNKAYEELESKIQERTHALVAANKELEAFSYSVSHDLRAPLRSMDGFSKALLRIAGDKFDEREKDYLKRIRESAQKMGELIDGMLTLSRIGRIEMKPKEVNLSQMAESIISELKQNEPERETEIKIEPDVLASADPTLIRVVMENLLDNAWKYTSKVSKTRIEFGVSLVNGRKIFHVRDNGAGFDMAYFDKLFGTFQRLHSAQEFPGTGVGLATVRRILTRHGGEVWAEGSVGKGATFYFTLGSETQQEIAA